MQYVFVIFVYIHLIKAQFGSEMSLVLVYFALNIRIICWVSLVLTLSAEQFAVERVGYDCISFPIYQGNCLSYWSNFDPGAKICD